MEVTNVKLKLKGDERVKASCSITLDDVFVVHDIKVVNGLNGLHVAMPATKFRNGEFHDIAHPITQEVREKINNAVMNEYNNQLQNQPTTTE